MFSFYFFQIFFTFWLFFFLLILKTSFFIQSLRLATAHGLSQRAHSAEIFYHFSGTRLQFQPAVLSAGLEKSAGWWGGEYPVCWLTPCAETNEIGIREAKTWKNFKETLWEHFWGYHRVWGQCKITHSNSNHLPGRFFTPPPQRKTPQNPDGIV